MERRASGRCAEKMVASWCDREVWDVGKVLLRALSGGNGLDNNIRFQYVKGTSVERSRSERVLRPNASVKGTKRVCGG